MSTVTTNLPSMSVAEWINYGTVGRMWPVGKTLEEAVAQIRDDAKGEVELVGSDGDIEMFLLSMTARMGRGLFHSEQTAEFERRGLFNDV